MSLFWMTFFFTSCKSDIEIKAKGMQSWTDYRLKLMTEAGRDLVLKPAKKVNPQCKGDYQISQLV